MLDNYDNNPPNDYGIYLSLISSTTSDIEDYPDLLDNYDCWYTILILHNKFSLLLYVITTLTLCYYVITIFIRYML